MGLNYIYLYFTILKRGSSSSMVSSANLSFEEVYYRQFFQSISNSITYLPSWLEIFGIAMVVNLTIKTKLKILTLFTSYSLVKTFFNSLLQGSGTISLSVIAPKVNNSCNIHSFLYYTSIKNLLQDNFTAYSLRSTNIWWYYSKRSLKILQVFS